MLFYSPFLELLVHHLAHEASAQVFCVGNSQIIVISLFFLLFGPWVELATYCLLETSYEYLFGN